jgi:hypothetical protein
MISPSSGVNPIVVSTEIPPLTAAMLHPATAAVPWPMTRTFVIEPSVSRAAIAGGRARSPTTARN